MVLIMLQGLFFVVSFAALIDFVYDDYVFVFPVIPQVR